MTNSITVIIADDHAVVRQGVRAFLEVQPDIEIVGEAASGDEAVRLVQESLPAVVLMDLVMSGMDGIKATSEIKRISPGTQVVILTSFYGDEHIFPALRAGALSYILKEIRPMELVHIVRQAAKSESFLHPRIAARVIQEVRVTPKNVPPAFIDLTRRELDVLRLIASGHPNTVIAEKLALSEKTVKGHISSIFSKLHIADRTQAAVLAWQQGLMSGDSNG